METLRVDCLKIQCLFKTFLQQGISEPVFYGDLVYKFKRISNQFKNTIKRYKRAGYNMDIMRQSSCMAVNPNHGL